MNSIALTTREPVLCNRAACISNEMSEEIVACQQTTDGSRRDVCLHVVLLFVYCYVGLIEVSLYLNLSGGEQL